MIDKARTFPNSIVTAICIDCGHEFTGQLGVRFVRSGDIDLVEVVVINDKRSEMHAIARVDYWDVPNTIETSNTHGRMGTA